MTEQPITAGDGPRIAAIESSGREGSVALGLGAKLVAQATLSATARHAVELMPALEKLCRQHGWLEETATPKLRVDEVYLSIGPGSFTGLRIAVAIARAMAQALGCRVVGVGSLEVIAQNAPAEFDVVVPVLDAKRGQVFAARFERRNDGLLACVSEPAVVDPAIFAAAALASAQGRRVAVMGEGVDYHRNALLSTGAPVEELPRESWIPRASEVHRLGWRKAQRGEYSPAESLLPIYIRLPEAEEVWRKKHGMA